MRESDIVHQIGKYWVGRDKSHRAYVVYKIGPSYSTSDSAYNLNDDGLSIAIARANYLAKMESTK
jgi:hypothetical protein